ncbi:MAG TPA: hypothetical protein PKD92_03275 [Novosphingobium sp.]|nr:hypothetical protein [Novosphingobium sp.]
MTTATAILADPALARALPRELVPHAPGDSGWLSPEEVAALTPELVRERIIAIKPLIASHAAESEKLRYPHPVVWEAIRATGFFYHFVPKAYRGCEFGPEDFFKTARQIAEACASTGWAATFICEHNWIAALYPQEAQERFFAGGRYVVAPAVSTPPGMARRVEGGYRVSAHWKWGSGVMHSDWNIGTAIVPGDDGRPVAMLWVAHPLSEARVLDTWHCAGLAATGSNDIVVDDIFIPDHMVLDSKDLQQGTTPGGRLHDNPLYRMPSTTFLGLVTSVPTIGAARGVVSLFTERLKTRKLVGTQSLLCEKANYQVLLAKADLMVRTAELLHETTTVTVLERAARGENHDVLGPHVERADAAAGARCQCGLRASYPGFRAAGRTAWPIHAGVARPDRLLLRAV